MGSTSSPYEGGESLVSSAFDSSVRAEITDFFSRLVDNPRMGILYEKMIAAFTAAGGSSINAFNDTGAGGIYGFWGTLDSIYDTGSARYDALLAAASGGHVSDVTTLVNALTSTVAPTLPAVQTTIQTVINTPTVEVASAVAPAPVITQTSVGSGGDYVVGAPTVAGHFVSAKYAEMLDFG